MRVRVRGGGTRTNRLGSVGVGEGKDGVNGEGEGEGGDEGEGDGKDARDSYKEVRG